MTDLLLIGTILLASTLQTTSGFGFVMIAMPLLTVVLGIRAAAPLVALAGSTLYAVNLLRYRQHVDLPEVGRLALAAAVGVPVGVWLLSSLESEIVEALLGVLLLLVAIYALWQPYRLESRITRRPYEDVLTAGIGRIPVGRLGTPEDVASLVAFLVSGEAAFITGQCYAVSGGRELT